MESIVVRRGLFVSLLFILPSLALFYQVYRLYRRYNQPLTSDYGDYELVCGGWSCRNFPKYVTNFKETSLSKSFLDKMIKIEYESYVNYIQNAKINQKKLKQLFMLDLVLAMLYPTSVLYVYLSHYLKLNGRNIERYRFGRKVHTIPVDKITDIRIETTTPFALVKSEIGKINWRDDVYLKFQNEKDEQILKVVLFAYPKFKKVVQKIIDLNPQIEVSFSKRSIIDNLRQMT